MAAASPPNASRAEALAYVEEQDLVELLNQALTQVVKERAPNGAARIAELLKKAAHRERLLRVVDCPDRVATERLDRRTPGESGLGILRILEDENLKSRFLHTTFHTRTHYHGTLHIHTVSWAISFGAHALLETADSTRPALSSRPPSPPRSRRSGAPAARAADSRVH